MSVAALTISERIVELDPLRDPRWARFVTAHPDGLIYHHPDWLRVLVSEYRADPVCLGYENAAGELRGILTLLPTRGLPFSSSVRTGRRLSSLPRTPVAGPLALDEQAAAALLRAALTHAGQEPSGTLLEIKAPSPLAEGLVSGLRCAPWRLTYTLELPNDPARIRFGDSRNHGRIRWALNKAEKLGVVVRPAESERDLARWYRIYIHTMRWHTVPPRPYRLFRAMWELLRPAGSMQLLLAEQRTAGQTRLLAGSVFLMLGKTAFYAFNGCWRSAMSLRANDAIQWRAIHDAAAAGFRHYDLGEVAEHQDGLHEFKSKWGAQATRLYRYYDARARDVASQAVGSNGHGRLATVAWRQLPPAVTAILGDHLYRYL